MPSKNPAQRLREIIAEIDFVEEATAGRSFDDFKQDGLPRRAVERSYSIIS